MFSKIPLAERMRPKSLDQFIGQEHLTAPGGLLRTMIENRTSNSILFWGPPGVGKTTLANIIAGQLELPFYMLSAIDSGVKDVRNVIQQAQQSGRALLFIDEIHRFNKAQQDSLLGAVEKGIITLIGATTENPSFEVIAPLLSRCQVYVLKHLSREHLESILHQAIRDDEYLKTRSITLQETEAMLRLSGGDARKLLNLLELVVNHTPAPAEVVITNKSVQQIAQQNIALYDKQGEQHYDIISAFIKSMRGSDPNAALYWLARMLAGGEDPKFIARRMLILSSEDIGNANPTAMVMANACFDAVSKIGYPECDLILAQTVIYLATSAKSNSTYTAIRAAQKLVETSGDLPVPLHLRNAPTKLMRELGYGNNYQYAHEYEGNFSDQEFLPDKVKGRQIYQPGNNSRENDVRRWLKEKWKNKYGY